jgi:hypothetical protein
VVDPTFIHVDDPVAGADLVRCLSRHGLIAGLVRIGSRWQVEVRSLGEDPRSFFSDLGVALASWSGTEGSTRGRSVRRAAA